MPCLSCELDMTNVKHMVNDLSNTIGMPDQYCQCSSDDEYPKWEPCPLFTFCQYKRYRQAA